MRIPWDGIGIIFMGWDEMEEKNMSHGQAWQYVIKRFTLLDLALL